MQKCVEANAKWDVPFCGKKTKYRLVTAGHFDFVAILPLVVASWLSWQKKPCDSVTFFSQCGVHLRTKIQDKIFEKIIDRNTQFPVEMTENFSTLYDNETSLSVRIFEGENPNVDKNHFLGEFILKIPAAPAGVPEIKVTFKIDENGILSVTAVDAGSGNKNSIQIHNDKGRLTQTEIVQMIEDIKSVALDEEDYIF